MNTCYAILGKRRHIETVNCFRTAFFLVSAPKDLIKLDTNFPSVLSDPRRAAHRDLRIMTLIMRSVIAFACTYEFSMTDNGCYVFEPIQRW